MTTRQSRSNAQTGMPHPMVHRLRVITRTTILILFLIDCIRLLVLYMWAANQIGINFGRPQLTAGLSPLGGLFDVGVLLKTGRVDPGLPASMIIILLGFTLSLCTKRSFCSWICPVSTVLDGLGHLGRHIFPGIHVSPRVDRILHAPATVIGCLIVGVTLFVIPAAVIIAQWSAPYWLFSDLSVLFLFVQPSPLIIVGIVVIALSLWLGRNVWCSYLCLLGAFYGLVSKASPLAITRNAEQCISCGACSSVCPAHIDVAASTKPLRSMSCTCCMECIAACPKDDALSPQLFGRTHVAPLVVAFIIGSIWFIIWMLALITGTWYGQIDPATLSQALTSFASAT